MKYCPKCKSNTLIQTSSFLTRILLTFYIFISIYLFTGEIMFQSIIAIIPLIIRYKYVCPNCDKTHYRFINLKQVNFYGERNNLDKVILGTLPYFLFIITLIILFPYTGLGRILFLPWVFFVNTLIIELSLKIIDKLNSKYRLAIGIITILITIIITAYFYPQDSGDKIWELF